MIRKGDHLGIRTPRRGPLHQTILSFLILLLLAATANGQGNEENGALSASPSQAIANRLLGDGVATADANRLVHGMLDAGFTADQMAQVERQIHMAGLNREARNAVAGKVLEGIAKHISPEAITRATVKVRERHTFAMQLAEKVLPGNPTALAGIVADNLTSGLTPQDAEKVVAALQPRAEQLGKDRFAGLATETVTTSRDIVRLGVSSATTANVIQTALATGYDATSMQTLRQSFNEQRMQSSMEQVARRYIRAMEKGIPAKELSRYGTDSAAAAEKNAFQGGSGNSGVSGGGSSGGGSGGHSGGGHGGGGGGGGRGGGGR